MQLGYKSRPPLQKDSTLVKLAETGVFLAVLMGVQALRLPNLITGVFVNAVFIFTVLHIKCGYALILGFLSPLSAIISGHMPPLLYPMIPVIMLGNTLLIFFYSILLKARTIFRVLVPSFCKASFIWVVGLFVISYFSLSENLKLVAFSAIAIQFFTSIAGIITGEKLNKSVKAKHN